jgi:hypothetical protein
MFDASTLLRIIKDRPAWSSLLLAAALIVSLCLAFDPCWMSNDDVAMSMIAHGYGLAAHGSPRLVFSNVLWGYLVRAIPTINGVLGYSIATLTVLMVAGWATLYFLLRLGAGYLLGILAVVLFIALPALIPQFTINAGLLTVAAVIGWQVHARFGGIGSLIAACLLAFFGYLIRDKEFLLVLGVALPFLPWRKLWERRQMQAVFLLLGVAIASAAAFDRWSYNGQEWQHFLEMDPNRTPLTDFINYGADEHLKQRPEILIRHNYSLNDIDLIHDWFFVDPQIADPQSLNAMLAELGPLPMQDGSVQAGFTAIKSLFDLRFLPVTLSAFLLLVLAPRWPVALAWVLCLAALFAMGVIGRPGILRVYVPLISLLLVAPLMMGQVRYGIRRWIAALTLVAACIGNAFFLIPDALQTKKLIQQAQQDIHGLPPGPIVIWGGMGFPYEFAFPLLANDLNSRNTMLYGLDSFTHAPFSVASSEQMAGRGMLERLRTATGISIIATQSELEMLRTYCWERLNGQLHGAITYQTSSLTVQQLWCMAGQ